MRAVLVIAAHVALLAGLGLTLEPGQAHQLDAADAQQARASSEALSAAGSRAEAVLRETITIAADEPIPHMPGKRLVSYIVDYPPGALSIPHHHPKWAFVHASVVSGAIRSQVDDGTERVYRAGEGWFENPGAYHRTSANASETEPARLLAVFIIDGPGNELVIPDSD